MAKSVPARRNERKPVESAAAWLAESGVKMAGENNVERITMAQPAAAMALAKAKSAKSLKAAISGESCQRESEGVNGLWQRSMAAMCNNASGAAGVRNKRHRWLGWKKYG
jgi:hypothetical protein